MAVELMKAKIGRDDAEQDVVDMAVKSGELAFEVTAMQAALIEVHKKLSAMEHDGKMANASQALSEASSPQRLLGSAQPGNAGAAVAAAAAAAALALPFKGITPRSSATDCVLALRAATEIYSLSNDAECRLRVQLIESVLDKGEPGALAQALAICMKLDIMGASFTRSLKAMERVAAALPHLAGTKEDWDAYLSRCLGKDKPSRERIPILRDFFAAGAEEAAAA